MVFAVLAPEALGFMGLGQRKACILCVHGCVCVYFNLPKGASAMCRNPIISKGAQPGSKG